MKKLLENKKMLAICGGVLAVVLIVICVGVGLGLKNKSDADVKNPSSTSTSDPDDGLVFGEGDPDSESETADPNEAPPPSEGDMDLEVGGDPNAVPGKNNGKQNVIVDGVGGPVQKPGVNINQSPTGPNQNSDNPTPDTPPVEPDDKPVVPDNPPPVDPVPMGNRVDLNKKGIDLAVYDYLRSHLLNNYTAINLRSFEVQEMNNETIENYVKTGSVVFNTQKFGTYDIYDYYLTKITVSDGATEDSVAKAIFDYIKNDSEWQTKYRDAFRRGNDGNASVYQNGKDFYFLYSMTIHDSLAI